MTSHTGKYCITIIYFVFMTLILSSCTVIENHLNRSIGMPERPAINAIHMETAMSEKSESAPDEQEKKEKSRYETDGPLTLTISRAVMLCLENNRSLIVERMNPLISKTLEDRERAAFDPGVSVELSAGREKTGVDDEDVKTDTLEAVILMEQYFPSGTNVRLEGSYDLDNATDNLYNRSKTRLGMTASQALMKGYGSEVNLASLKQARLDTRMSEYELRGFAESLVADVESAYWDYALALRQVEIVEESLKVARQQLSETEKQISVGRYAKSELAAVQAEVAAQEKDLIAAKAEKESIRLKLLRHVNPPDKSLWSRAVYLAHQPVLPDIALDEVETHVGLAKRMRPLLNEARLEIEHGDLELVKTKNGLLPAMELFVTLGKSGYSDAFGGSAGNITDNRYDAFAGIRFSYPFYNRDAKAAHTKARLTRDQAEKALENLIQLVEYDVYTAYIEVNSKKEQIAATAVIRRFNEEKLRIETEKLLVGKSTSFLVAQAQRDLLVSRIDEVKALTNYLKALIDLFRMDGSLLERRGISSPGNEPVTLFEKPHS